MQVNGIARSESDVIQTSFEKFNSSKRVRVGFLWALINFMLAAFAITEIFFGSVLEVGVIYQAPLWYIEVCVAIWCTIRFISETFLILTWLLENPVILTAKQYQLLAVNSKDSRFSPIKPISPNEFFTDDSPSIYSQKRTPVFPISDAQINLSPLQSGINSFGVMSYGGVDCTSSLLYDNERSMYQTSPGSMSFRKRFVGSGSPSFTTRTSPVLYNDFSMNQAKNSSILSSTPTRAISISDDRLRNADALNSFLQFEEDRREVYQGGLKTSPHGLYQWSSFGSHVEYNTPLSVYKIGTRSPLSATAKDEDEYGHMSPQAEELWSKFGISRQDLDIWTENLRKWISQTVVCELVREIDDINLSLQKMGSSELQIGSINLGSLRLVSTNKAEHLPTLAAVLPYLELSYNQEYLVERIKELGEDSCMGVYRWKSGSHYRGRNWDQDLPTDAQIVMHVFCTYMDSRLPTDARFQDGRSFTGLYFLKDLDKLDSKKRDLAIHRFQQNPPHFKVISGDEVYDVGKGRNNLFHTIILFLILVKRRQHGMLGRVNLGPSGVNILGIFNKR